MLEIRQVQVRVERGYKLPPTLILHNRYLTHEYYLETLPVLLPATYDRRS